MTPPGPHPSAQAEQAFADYLRQVEDGTPVDFDRFCAERLHLADELHRIKADWDHMEALVDGLGSLRMEQPVAASDPAGTPVALALAADEQPEADGPLADQPTADPPASGASAIADVLRRLAAHRTPSGRYAPRGEIARGGMGVVLRMWDGDLRRNLAMKVLRDGQHQAGRQDHLAHTRRLSRFLEEAQITGQLDHPGIVPVHELGLDAEGRLYFTMRLVRGRCLDQIVALVREQREGWTLPRAVGVLLRVCEAMAFAHSKSVIHRDLKPANVMVGRFGEVYVMDWGLAKVMGRRDLHDIRPLTTMTSTLSAVRTDRNDAAHASPDSPLVTLDGSVVGTPAYMSPEQARGQVAEVGPASDVYAVGALLYELLAGRRPYRGEEHVDDSPYSVLAAVRERPPRPVHELAPRVPAELAAICERAMARSIGDRYDGMLALAEDLRAWLEGRVVAAYEDGALAELRKWVLRNRATAAIVLLSLLGLGWLTFDLVTKNDQLAEQTKVLGAALAVTAHEKDQRAEAQRAAEQAASDARTSAAAAELAAEAARRSSYVSAIAAADGSLRLHQPAEARRRLGEAPAELRGWEWRHLALVADPSLAVLQGHGERVTSLAFAPSGALLASGSWDGTVRLWEVATGSPAALLDHGGVGVVSLAFHPDGHQLASADREGALRLWDARTGERLLDLPTPGSGPQPVRELAFSPTGHALFVAAGRQVHAWLLDEARWLVFPEVNRALVNALAVSPDGALLVSGSDDATLQVWDATSATRRSELFQHESAVLAVAHGPIADQLVSGCEDGSLRLFAAERGVLLATLPGHGGPVRAVDINPDGSALLSGGDDGTLRLWTSAGEPLAVLMGHKDAVLAARFSPDGQLLASASRDRDVRLWDVAWGAGAATLAGHGGRVTALALCTDGRRAATASGDGRLHLWDLDDLTSPAATELPGEGSAALAFRPDGRRLAAGSQGTGPDGRHPIAIWDSARPDVLAPDPLPLDGHAATINALAWDASGRVLASAADDGTARLWDGDDGRLLATLEGHAGKVTSVAFHPAESWLASGGVDGSVRLWSRDGGSLGVIGVGSGGGSGVAVNALAFDRGGRLLAVASQDGIVRLFDASTRALLSELRGHQGDVLALAFHPDEPRLASSSADGTLRVWDTTTGLHLLTRLLPAASPSIGFDAGGRRLLAAIGDRVLVLETVPAASSFRARTVRASVTERAQLALGELLDRLVDPRAVQLALQDDRELDADVRAEALRLARHVGTNPDQLAEMAWGLLVDGRAGEQARLSALRLARAAQRLRPDDTRFVNLVGVALFRTGDDRAALATLERSRASNLQQNLYPTGWDLLFIAMAHQRLGSRELARTFLHEALSLSPGDPLTVSLETEAREFIEGR